MCLLAGRNRLSFFPFCVQSTVIRTRRSGLELKRSLQPGPRYFKFDVSYFSSSSSSFPSYVLGLFRRKFGMNSPARRARASAAGARGATAEHHILLDTEPVTRPRWAEANAFLARSPAHFSSTVYRVPAAAATTYVPRRRGRYRASWHRR